MRSHLAILLLFVLLVIADKAKALELVTSSGDWDVLQKEVRDKKSGSLQKICYAVSKPVARGALKSEVDPYAMIATKDGKTLEISFKTGVKFKEGSEATMVIDGQSFRMFTENDMAWAFTEAQDNKAIKEMSAGKALAINGITQNGGQIEDGYSLSRFSAAVQNVKRLCEKKQLQQQKQKKQK